MQSQEIQREGIKALMIGIIGASIASITGAPIPSTAVITSTIVLADSIFQHYTESLNERHQLRYSRVQLLKAASDTLILVGIIFAFAANGMGQGRAVVFGSWAALSIIFHLAEATLSVARNRDRHDHHFFELNLI